CSRLPDSPLGRRVINPLRGAGVTVEIDWDEEARQGTYFIEQGGAPRGTSVIYDRADAAVTTTTPADLPMAAIRDADAFFTTGITPALSVTLEETTRTVLREAANAGTMTAFDVNYRSKLWEPKQAAGALRDLLPLLDVLAIAERDAASVLGRDGSPDQVARDLRTAYDLEIAIVTAGEAGAIAAGPAGVHEEGAIPADTIDPIGTGDAFLGGFLAWYVTGADLAEALSAGAATASLKRTLKGDHALLSRAEVERVMERGGREIDR
ncbi:MAG: PfkB family carbohydrate kinase, partial [Halodesulfurarchaeum sp.]